MAGGRGWKQVKQAWTLMQAREGQTVTLDELTGATGWTVSTVRTYVSKRWAGILRPDQTRAGAFLVVGADQISFQQFRELHSQVVRPALAPTPSQYDFDVALSFAGEDRGYVDSVARVLRAYGVRVFYDRYEQHSLWGKDLYVHLDEVYRVRSRYCVMFVSTHYATKLWTTHERRSAQARAFSERQEYLLPYRLDDTDIPGLPPTVGYLSDLTPERLADAVVAKLGTRHEFEDMLRVLVDYLGPLGYVITQVEDELEFVNKREDFEITLAISMLLEAHRSSQLEHIFLRSSVFVQ